MANLNCFCFLVACIFLFSTGNAQDCTLGIGGKDTETIIKVFQLSDEQIGKMEGWSAELEIENRQIEEQIQELFDTHPQNTPEELTLLATKYKVLQEKMVNVSKAYDKKLLATFNEKQYKLYANLCEEAFRQPMIVNPE